MQTLLYETNDKTIRAYSILSDKQNLNSNLISFFICASNIYVFYQKFI